jgi:hypothetical protein
MTISGVFGEKFGFAFNLELSESFITIQYNILYSWFNLVFTNLFGSIMHIQYNIIKSKSNSYI